jgi:hypothetical protein
MMIDGWPCKIILKGDSTAAGALLPYAGQVAKQMNACKVRNKTVKVKDATIQIQINPPAKLFTISIEAEDIGHSIAFFPTKIRMGGSGYETSGDTYGKPYKNTAGEPINDPIGTLNGTVPGWTATPELYDVPGYVPGTPIKYTINKSVKNKGQDRMYWGCNDWVHTKETTNGERKLLGYVTFGTKQGRSNSILRYSDERYELGTPYSDFIPPITHEPEWHGTTNALAVYYNGARVVSEAPGHVLGAAIVELDVSGVRKKYVLGVSAGQTGSVIFYSAFNSAGKTSPKNFILWTHEIGSTNTPQVVGTVSPSGTSKFFDYAPLFAFNASATKCSAVIRTYFPCTDPDFAGLEGPGSSLGPMVFHVDWTDIAAPTVTSEPPPSPVENSTTSVTYGNFDQDEYPLNGGMDASGGYHIAEQTVAIDYRGDTEVRMLYTRSYSSIATGVTQWTEAGTSSSRQATSTTSETYSIGDEWSTTASRSYSSLASHATTEGAEATQTAITTGEKTTHIVYLDLRYPVVVWYEIEMDSSYSIEAPSQPPVIALQADRSYAASSVYTLNRFVSGTTEVINSTTHSDSYQDAWSVGGFGAAPVYGGSPGTWTDVTWPELYSFSLNHRTWVGLNLVDGHYWGFEFDWTPYLSSYEASSTVGTLVKQSKPFELYACAFSISYRPLRCGFRGESLFDRREELYSYGSFPDGLRESGRLDLLNPDDFIKSVGIGR